MGQMAAVTPCGGGKQAAAVTQRRGGRLETMPAESRQLAALPATSLKVRPYPRGRQG
jgi:hypothetical protein